MKTVFVCEGGPTLGLGHVMRCLALADAIADRREPIHFIAGDDSARRIIRAAGYEVNPMPADADDVIEQVAVAGPDLIVIDNNDYDHDLCASLRQIAPLVNLAPQKHPKWYADVTINSTSVLDTAEPHDNTAARRWYRSPAYAFIGKSLLAARDAGAWPIRNRDQRVLVSLGAGDELKLIEQVIPQLDAIPTVAVATLVVGAAFNKHEALKPLIADRRVKWTIVAAADNWPSQMREHDWAITAMGLTTYESLCVGLPTAAICPTRFHLHLGRELETARALIAIDATDSRWPATLVERLSPIAKDAASLESLRRNGQTTIDGRGAQRAAGVITWLYGRAPCAVAIA